MVMDSTDNIAALAVVVGGFIGWLWVWTHTGFATGKRWQTQLGVLLMGGMWLCMIQAMTLQEYEPTTSSIVGHLMLIAGQWLLSHKLRTTTNGSN